MSSHSLKPPQKRSVQTLEIGSDEAGQRIDNFLFSHLKGVPKSRVYRLLRKGEVRVNKGRIKAQYRLQTGDCVRIPPITVQPAAEVSTRVKGMGAILESRIVYQDEYLIVLNKPAHMAVHGGSGLHGGVIEALRVVKPREKCLELVHRLDKATSGCLLIAKRKQTLRKLHAMFRTDQVDKRYLALLTGNLREAQRTVDVPLEKFVLAGGERLVKVSGRGKSARTDFRRLESFDQASLVEARLFTGRTHQIRVHAAHLGHPIAGDERYGREDANKKWRQLGLKRMFLHAWRMRLTHPETGEVLSLEAPLDSETDLIALLARLSRSPQDAEGSVKRLCVVDSSPI